MGMISVPAVAGPKTKFDATSDPTVNDDVTLGYAVGSRWVNVSTAKEFVCLDATDGAAVWVLTTGAGGGLIAPTPVYSTTRYVVPGWAWSGVGSDLISLGRLYYIPIYVARSTSYDRIAVRITTQQAGALLRLGLYEWSNGQPGALVFDAGTVSGATTGVKEITIDKTLAAGMYFLALVVDTGGLEVRVMGSTQTSLQPVTGFTITPGDVGNATVLYKSGQAGLVAAGLSTPAPAPNGYGSAPEIAICLREVN